MEKNGKEQLGEQDGSKERMKPMKGGMERGQGDGEAAATGMGWMDGRATAGGGRQYSQSVLLPSPRAGMRNAKLRLTQLCGRRCSMLPYAVTVQYAVSSPVTPPCTMTTGRCRATFWIRSSVRSTE